MINADTRSMSPITFPRSRLTMSAPTTANIPKATIRGICCTNDSPFSRTSTHVPATIKKNAATRIHGHRAGRTSVRSVIAVGSVVAEDTEHLHRLLAALDLPGADEYAGDAR